MVTLLSLLCYFAAAQGGALVQVRVPRPALLLSHVGVGGQLGEIRGRFALEEGVGGEGTELAIIPHFAAAQVD